MPAWFNVSNLLIHIIIYTLHIKQYGIHQGSYVFSSYFQHLSVTTTTTDAFCSKSLVNTVAS